MFKKQSSLEIALTFSTFVVKYWNNEGDMYFIPYPDFGRFGGLKMTKGYFYQTAADKPSNGINMVNKAPIYYYNGNYSKTV